MRYLEKFFALIILLTTAILLTNCGGVSTGKSGNSGTTSSGSGSGGTGSGGGGQTIPGYGEGIGASGQTRAPKFLYANPLPGGGPYAANIGSSGTVSLTTGGSGNNLDPETLAIDPAGSFIFQTALGNGGTQGGILVYAINRSNGSPGNAIASYETGQTMYADVIDNKGKFLYALSTVGVFAFSIQTGTGVLTPVPGSPFAAAGASSAGFSQPANLMGGRENKSVPFGSATGGGIGAT